MPATAITARNVAVNASALIKVVILSILMVKSWISLSRFPSILISPISPSKSVDHSWESCNIVILGLRVHYYSSFRALSILLSYFVLC